jgi:hypothetical protein
MSTLVASPPRPRRNGDDRPRVSARLAVYHDPLSPPEVDEVEAAEAAALIEELFRRAAAHTPLPALAVRELIENLVHARFRDALVSVLDRGRTLRVSDSGPGIADKARAMEPGFTTADAEARRVVRGVGCGLPLAADLLAERGGSLELADNLAGGTVATLAAPTGPDGGEVWTAGDPPICETGRRLLALLVELSPIGPARLASELGLPLAECGRELVVLEHRGLVLRDEDGERRLAESGASLVATLF